MSYFRRGSAQSRYVVDRLPIYVFPAFVGSGRILLGMALAGITTAIILHSHTPGDRFFWWLGLVAYMASVVLVVSGIFAVNVVPPQHSTSADYRPAPGPPEPSMSRTDLGPLAPPVAPASDAKHSHLANLLVNQWRLVTQEQLSRAAVRQANSGRSLAHELTRMGLLTDEDLERILAHQQAPPDSWKNMPREQ